MATSEKTAGLLRYLSTDLTPSVVPEEVWLRIEDLFLDWLASALGSKGSHPIPIFERTARQMGPSDGPSQILVNESKSSPYWAAWVNAASSHTLEQDDLHNSSVMHPATVIFPAVLAAAQDNGKSGKEMLLASIAGYEAGIRIAESLGRSHYRLFHTTGTVGTVAAALAVAKLLLLDVSSKNSSDEQQQQQREEQLLVSALGTAGTQASGLWEFLRSGDAGDSKQLHCAHAAANGLLSAYMARDGMRGARDVIEGEAGLMRALAKEKDVDAAAARLTDRLHHVSGPRPRWAVLETSFKFHACCRHTHPAADALLDAMARYGIQRPLAEIKRVVAHVHQGALDVLGPVDAAASPPPTVHAAKFSMKTTLALIALRGSASLLDFAHDALTDPDIAQFRERVSMVLDPEVDGAYPQRWLGRVEVELADGRVVKGVCDEPKGDPGNTLTRPELEDKFRRLVAYGQGTDSRAQQLISWCWSLRKQQDCLLPGAGKVETNGTK